ncbi:hypothetical protein K523DRAFT_240548 [Schizophyllum commune Tattone D]|nr:hypothetical protein K525DRAFT_205069 [Schizophyllum commune Loenen D]KAI5830097.1 hypothetical protein K523DRAFT_240548 [Schizophyllum commune Tattone D]
MPHGNRMPLNSHSPRIDFIVLLWAFLFHLTSLLPTDRRGQFQTALQNYPMRIPGELRPLREGHALSLTATRGK